MLTTTPTEVTDLPAPNSVKQTTCAVVVVHYRNLEDSLGCIASIRRQAIPGTQVVLVDNASIDSSGTELASHFESSPDVTVIRTQQNLGFGAGSNTGIDHALASFPGLQHLLLLTPDARLRIGALAALRSCMQHHPSAGIVGCRIVNSEGNLWFANGRIPRWTMSTLCTRPPGDRTEHPSGFVSGCCMLLDVAMLRKGIRFDESFFLYGEDADLCFRVLQRGRSIWVTQAATVEHRSGGSQPGRPVLDALSADQLYWTTRARVRLANKHFGPVRKSFVLTHAALVAALQNLLRTRSWRWINPYFRGLLAGATGR